MDNVAAHLQRLQLGASSARPSRRRARAATATATATRDAPPTDPHACMRRLLAPSFRSGDSATYLHQSATSGCATPVFQVAFAPAQRHRGLLAAVDEDGAVSLVDTTKPPPPQSARDGVLRRAHHAWRAHENAIFDLAWARDASFLLTAAGDLRVCAWDVEAQRALFTLRGGHSMSVKSVRQSRDHDDVIATGARDGNVLVWDARTPSRPVAQLLGVHSSASPSPSPSPSPSLSSSSSSAAAAFVSPAGSRKRRKTAAAVTSSPRSVTSVEFLAGGHEIVTAGAVDGVVKFWDLRRLTAQRKIALSSSINSASAPLRVLSCASRAGAQRGITSLALDASRSRLLVSVLNDELCVVDVHARHAAAPPQLRLDGHVASSFYVKSTFSPDGDFVMSGSGDGAVYVWDARTTNGSGSSRVRSPTLALKGHAGEVNGVAWHESDFSTLATCSDDGTVRVWTADRAADAEAPEAAAAFRLARRERQWQNWRAFEAQENGRAYVVDTRQAGEEEAEEEQKRVAAAAAAGVAPTPRDNAKRLLTSPPVIRRNPAAFRAAAAEASPATHAAATRRVRAPQSTPPRRQTLLDFWAK